MLGAALGKAGKAFAIVGDGAMLMQNEIDTAATYELDAVWIVLNDARYGMIAQGMQSIGWSPFETDFPRTDFVAIARAMGGDGVAVHDEASLDAALERALEARGPFVVDMMIDPTERARHRTQPEPRAAGRQRRTTMNQPHSASLRGTPRTSRLSRNADCVGNHARRAPSHLRLRRRGRSGALLRHRRFGCAEF
ncbi:MAG: thiamine pyrophosphate-dependent enzyme [Polyangiaceae bacterium]